MKKSFSVEKHYYSRGKSDEWLAKGHAALEAIQNLYRIFMVILPDHKYSIVMRRGEVEPAYENNFTGSIRIRIDIEGDVIKELEEAEKELV